MKLGNVDISTLKISYVEVDSNMYQLAVVAKITNLTNKPLAVDQLVFTGDKIDMISRGVYRMPLIDNHFNPIILTNNEIAINIVGKPFLKPKESHIYKGLLPIKQDITIEHGSPFEIIFHGDWVVIDSDSQSYVSTPRAYGNNESIISLNDWNQESEINAILKLPPQNNLISDTTQNFILYNRDRSANTNLYGYCTTNYVRSQHGVMVIVRGAPNPTLTDGWKILGRDYQEIWKDHKKLTLYNKVYPPNRPNQKPKPFGAFSGIEMKAGESSPTTRCADCISVNIKSAKMKFNK